MKAGRVIGGKYRLEREIARGGMGAVWLARHTELDVEVAIKVMAKGVLGAPKALERFRREARAAARLKSPHVVHIYDYGVDHGAPFIAMELLEGTDLKSHLETSGPLSLERTATILRQIGKALRVAHDAGLVHRDLKPANVFLASSGGEEIVKVLDFGIAKELKPTPEESATGSEVLLGTPAYMSPEQARSGGLDARADIWSAGVIVFEMLTGENPFRSAALGEVFARIGWEPLPVPTDVMAELPSGVDDFMARALARDPAERFPSVTAMVRAFDAAVEGRPLPEIESEIEETPRRPSARAAARNEPAPFARDEPTADVSATLPASVTAVAPQDETAPPTITATPRAAPTTRRRWLGLGAALGTVALSVALWQTTRPDDLEAAAEPAAQPASSTSSEAVFERGAPPVHEAAPSEAASADEAEPDRLAPTPSTTAPEAPPTVAARPASRPAPAAPKHVAAPPPEPTEPPEPAEPPPAPDPIFGVKVVPQ